STTPGGQTSAVVGGLLALPSNIGNFQRNRFGVVPQVGLKVGYNLTDNLRVYVGYDFLWWCNVVRPGDQIDTN
ncbi:BBP7 family outer membrane beta-barrel protein, partial [Escherichia coli]